jgi:hypothetical protein
MTDHAFRKADAKPLCAAFCRSCNGFPSGFDGPMRLNEIVARLKRAVSHTWVRYYVHGLRVDRSANKSNCTGKQCGCEKKVRPPIESVSVDRLCLRGRTHRIGDLEHPIEIARKHQCKQIGKTESATYSAKDWIG